MFHLEIVTSIIPANVDMLLSSFLALKRPFPNGTVVRTFQLLNKNVYDMLPQLKMSQAEESPGYKDTFGNHRDPLREVVYKVQT